MPPCTFQVDIMVVWGVMATDMQDTDYGVRYPPYFHVFSSLLTLLLLHQYFCCDLKADIMGYTVTHLLTMAYPITT